MALLAGALGGIEEDGAEAWAGLGPQLDHLLCAGGGGEIWPDPVTGRNNWGATLRPADHEIWFSSTSAQAIGRRAWDATLTAFARLTRAPGCAPLSQSAWFDEIRARVARGFSGADCRVLLAASPVEARELARAVARTLLRRRVAEVATSAEECTQFQTCGRESALAGFVALRTRRGDPRDAHDIDEEALQLCQSGLATGHGLLLHVLDTSKTGLSGISRGAARAVQKAAPERVLCLVDAGEGRAYVNEVRRALANGMMVLVSGSQFIGGPPFSAALLLPWEISQRLAEGPGLQGPWPLCARFDAPQALRECFAPAFSTTANTGLGLRWMAALAEHDAYFAVGEALRRETLETFSRKARAMAARCGFMTCEPPATEDLEDPLRDSILSLIPDCDGGLRAALDLAAALRTALAQPLDGFPGDAICHIGRPVPIGQHAALTLSASAPLVSGVARRMSMGLSFERAMAPVLRDLGTLFRKWEFLAG